jgi:hypothetical protein
MKAQIQRGSVLSRLPVMGDNINSIVIFDDDDQPLMAIEQIGSATVQVTRADEPSFGAALARLRVLAPVPKVTTG